jgi:predicted RNase H-like HicB family nuclease
LVGFWTWSRASAPHILGPMKLTITFEATESGRWIADVVEIPGAFAEAETAWEAGSHAQANALRAIADRLDALDLPPRDLVIEFHDAA